MCLTPWKLPITRPNCTRSLAKATALIEHVLRGAQRIGGQHDAPGVEHAQRRRHAGRWPRPARSAAAPSNVRSEHRPRAIEAAAHLSRETPVASAVDQRRPAVRQIDQKMRRRAAHPSTPCTRPERRLPSQAQPRPRRSARRCPANAMATRVSPAAILGRNSLLLRLGGAVDQGERRHHQRWPRTAPAPPRSPAPRPPRAASSTPSPAPP